MSGTTATRFALLGLLLVVGACEPGPPALHTEGRSDCARCHMPEYVNAKKPVHVGARPTACAVCHTQSSWSPSVFEHPWPLTGAHARARCASCHVGQPPVYAGTSKLCVDCHRKDFESSEFPGHARFASTCADCHSTSAWTPARRPAVVDAGSEPTASPHRRARAVHETGPAPHTQRGAPQAARGVAPTAHEAPQAAPENAPEPAAASTSTEAAAPTAPSHPESRFPIASGPHAGIGCRTCHDQGGAFGRDDTDCVQCHTRARFDPIHDGVRNYPEGPAPPNFCLRCHASGRVRGR
ncbi:MAG: hypothetical protein ACHQ53_14905 [Polyangiales bacterium]